MRLTVARPFGQVGSASFLGMDGVYVSVEAGKARIQGSFRGYVGGVPFKVGCQGGTWVRGVYLGCSWKSQK